MPRNTPRSIAFLPTFSPLGDRAVMITVGTDISVATHYRVRATMKRLAARNIPGIVEAVPAFASVVAHYEPLAVPAGVAGESPYTRLVATLRSELADIDVFEAVESKAIEIPVSYGGAFGPDLEDVAQRHGLSVNDVVGIHERAEYLVYMVGFVPGFAYLGGLPPEIATPRRAEPRTHVPAGTVGIGGSQTGVYPMVSPGGWNLIGKTPTRMFDPLREPASLLAIGDRVRFRAVSREHFQSIEDAL